MNTLWEVKLTLKYLLSKEPDDVLLQKAFDAVDKKYDQVCLDRVKKTGMVSSSNFSSSSTFDDFGSLERKLNGVKL